MEVVYGRYPSATSPAGHLVFLLQLRPVTLSPLGKISAVNQDKNLCGYSESQLYLDERAPVITRCLPAGLSQLPVCLLLEQHQASYSSVAVTEKIGWILVSVSVSFSFFVT